MDVPEDIAAKARDIVERIAKGHPWKAACVADIEAALLAERLAATERAAKIAETASDDWVGENGAAACLAIAAAIRQP